MKPVRAWARFDDLITGSALLCPQPDRVLVADRAADVRPVLEQVQRATDAGRWAFGYVAYEAAAGLDPSLAVHDTTPFGIPLAWFGLCDRPTAVPALQPPPDAEAPDPGVSWQPLWTAAGHAARVEVIKDQIARGETYQCNLTERLTGGLDGDPYELYRTLALGQRGAHNAYLDLGAVVIASASPELFFERRGDLLTLRPMKGTSRRGRFPAEDRQRAAELCGSAKERAENLMIVDLMRNDVSRIAEVGTVAVPRLFAVERYETVLQLTSDVTARLRPGTGLAEIFTALFPCGSVTGAPKASSMKIIRSVEAEPRGVYCGAIGLVSPPDEPVRARFSVAIRTAVVDVPTRRAVYGTGGGITWDSNPAAEHAEIRVKAALLRTRPVAFQLLETMRVEGGSIHNGDLHLERIASSAEHLGFRFDGSRVSGLLRERLSGRPDPARVRLLLDRDGTVHVDVTPIPPAPATVVLAVDDEPVDPELWWLHHKTTLRREYDRRRDRRPEVDDVIMVNTAGELTEVTRSTLAVRIGDQWWTPPREVGCLPGVERARLLAGGVLRERRLTVAELTGAQGLAVLSSLRGWRSARLDSA
ncbi:aminodeoxychorismate synthase component I [Microlunatus ginsengisoli]|uniref:Aminodeoxychorismate synthase component I n=1 Tax=Microlunatus ginsengisoli TaxID=363863 RepID=A0ABP7AIN2_9ACTN